VGNKLTDGHQFIVTIDEARMMKNVHALDANAASLMKFDQIALRQSPAAA